MLQGLLGSKSEEGKKGQAILQAMNKLKDVSKGPETGQGNHFIYDDGGMLKPKTQINDHIKELK